MIGYEGRVSKLPHVQGLRAFAALCVVAFHAQSDATVVAARLGTSFATNGAFPWLAGVDIFFVISGFIMVYASSRLFGSARGPWIFLAHRIARIVPLYWATMLLYLVVVLVVPALVNSEYLTPGFVISSFLFIPAARPDGVVQPLYSLGWTLNYEMFFYALFAIAVAFPRRRGVPALIAALILLVTLGQVFAPLPQPFAFWSDPIILEFAMGMALGWISARGGWLNRPGRLVLAVAGLTLFMLDLTRAQELLALPRAVAYGVPAALLVAAAALPFPDRRDAPNALTRCGVVLGDASYALYLLHPFVIRALRELLWRGGLAGLVGAWGFVLLSIACAGALAVLVNRLFERPVTVSVRRLMDGTARSSRHEDLAREPGSVGRRSSSSV